MMFRTPKMNDAPSPAGALLRAARRKLRTRAAAALAAGVMLVAALGTLGYAWYTRTVNTYAVTFEVAEYDLSVNENVEDSYLLDIYRYSSVQNDRFAPGMLGYMPMVIAVYHSDIDVEYTIELVNYMPDEVRDHIGIFYLAEEGEGGTYKPYYGEALEAQDLAGITTFAMPVTVGTGTKNLKRVYLKKEPEDSSDPTISDTLRVAANEPRSKKLCLYWEWFLDMDAAVQAGAAAYETGENAPAEQQAQRVAWDAQDTDIGRYPKKYVDAFYVYLNASGTQVTPDAGTATRPNPNP